jgi:hypothetical protein
MFIELKGKCPTGNTSLFLRAEAITMVKEFPACLEVHCDGQTEAVEWEKAGPLLQYLRHGGMALA